MKDNIKNRNRHWTLLLYPKEDITHEKAIEYIKNNYEYAMINHNKDTTEDGEIKKEHIHLVFTTGSNARWKSAVAEELGISMAYIEGCNRDKQLLYLIHKENPDKYQYKVEEVEGNLRNRLIELLEKEKTDTENAQILIKYIKDNYGKIGITKLTTYAIEKGIYNTLRKSAYLYNEIIKESKKFGASNKHETR